MEKENEMTMILFDMLRDEEQLKGGKGKYIVISCLKVH